MEDQSRGTRNIINEFLLMPANREIFCSQNSIDFDWALANGEVTVCNYNLASGDTDAVAFGLFFLLSFNNAVLSRPGTEFTRVPHFFYVDELPVLIHPSLEKNFSLFRKFRVAMTVAIQTLDQMEKNEITKYLKGVILGAPISLYSGGLPFLIWKFSLLWQACMMWQKYSSQQRKLPSLTVLLIIHFPAGK